MLPQGDRRDIASCFGLLQRVAGYCIAKCPPGVHPGVHRIDVDTWDQDDAGAW